MRSQGVFQVLLIAAMTTLGSCSLFVSSQHRTENYVPVFAAADACDLGKVCSEIDQDGGLLRATEWDDATLLHDAVGHNCKDLTAWLIARGADVNARKTDGVTPLHVAAQRGNIAIAELLLGAGAKIGAIDSKGWTPLDRARRWNHPDTAEFLKQHGAP